MNRLTQKQFKKMLYEWKELISENSEENNKSYFDIEKEVASEIEKERNSNETVPKSGQIDSEPIEKPIEKPIENLGDYFDPNAELKFNNRGR